MYKYIAAVSFLASSVAAHGAVTSYVIDGIAYPGYKGFSPDGKPVIQRPWPNYNTVEGGCTAAAMRCNLNGNTPAALSAPVKPGGSISALWSQWTHVPSTVSVYLYKCPGEFSSCDGSGAGWFKIDEMGWVATTTGLMQDADWAGNRIMSTGKHTSTIPSNLAPGNYIVRHELIALHQANNPQYYPECAQITVTGSGTALPPASAKIAIPGPGFCVGNEPNLYFNIDARPALFTPATFKVNGPPVWNGAGGAAVTTVAPTTTTTTTTTTTRTTTPTTSMGGPETGCPTATTVTLIPSPVYVTYTPDVETIYVTSGVMTSTTTTTSAGCTQAVTVTRPAVTVTYTPPAVTVTV